MLINTDQMKTASDILKLRDSLNQLREKDQTVWLQIINIKFNYCLNGVQASVLLMSPKYFDSVIYRPTATLRIIR